MRTLKRLVACAVLAWAPAVFAFSIVEIGDAGDLPGTAQATTGTGDLLSIAGAIGDANDVDMFRIQVTGAVPVLLQASPVSTIDSQLFLFDSMGLAIVGNDDLGLSLDASITFLLAAGTYFVAVSSWDRDPVNAANQEIFADVSGTLQLPINGGGPIAGYNDVGAPGSYIINVRGVTGTVPGAVPEPGTLALLASGVAGLVASRRRTLR